MTPFRNARWIIAADSASTVDSYYNYRQTFALRGGQPVTLRISAHTNYAVYVNGAFVDCGQLPDRACRMIYDTLELTAYTAPGENLLEITQYVAGEAFMTSNVQVPGLVFALFEGEAPVAVSSPETLSRRDPHYRSNAEKMTLQLGFTFDYDMGAGETAYAPSLPVDKPLPEVSRPVKKLVIGQPQAGKLLAQGAFLENDPGLSVSKRIHSAYLSALPRKNFITEEPDGIHWCLPEDRRADGTYLLFDLGGETIGYPLIRLEVTEPAEILVGFGEHLEDLRVRSACGYRNFAFRILAKPGENLFFHPFRRLGLRYLQLHIYSKSGTVRQVSICPTRYPMTHKPITVTDRLHRRIWQMSAKTLELCMQDYFCDCVWREQAMYPYDGRMEALYSYYAFEAPEFAREAFRVCADSLRPDGLLEMCAPGTEPSNSPAYSAVYLRAIWEYTEHTGDRTLAEEIFPVLETICHTFAARIRENGLIPMFEGSEYWHFCEWQPGMDGKIWGTLTREVFTEPVYEVPLNAFVADGFRCMALLCQKDRPALAEHYHKLYTELADSLHRHFYRDDQGGYLTRLTDEMPHHELSQGLMLYLGRVPAECRRKVEALIRQKSLLETTLGMSVYTYEGLLQNPENRAFVLEDVLRRWGRMLESGYDTFWETERGPADFNGAGDLCQGWSAQPLYLFSRYGLE